MRWPNRRGWTERATGGHLLALCLTALVGGASCTRADPPAPPSLVRMLAAPGPGVGTAAIERAEIGGETRPVLARSIGEVLIWRRDVSLDADVRLALSLPHSLRGASPVWIEAWVSAPDPGTKGLSARQLRLRAGTRHRLEAEPMLVAGDGSVDAAVHVPVPDAFAGLTGWLNAIALPIHAEPLQRHAWGPLDVAAGQQLAFGYGVAEDGWRADFPPVVFRVFAEPASGPRALLFEHRIDPARAPADRRWHDARLDLGPLAGESVRFVFEHEAIVGAEGASVPGSFPLLANPMLVSTTAHAATARNLVLISLDTLRAANVGAYGYARDTTPTLDSRVAAAGALMEQALAPQPFTPPSHMTMLTGLEPCAHGVVDRHGVLSPDRTLLAEWLRDRAYATAAFTEDAYVVARAGFARGFDRYMEERDEETAAPGFAAETFAAAETWLRAREAGPFFLFVHTYEVHDPYTPPASYEQYFANDGLEDGVRRRFRAARDAYDREIRRTDDVLARFLDTLDALGLTDDTLLVVTSDHGEEFGEHFWTGHGASLHERAVRIPLLLRAPGLIAPGTRIPQPVTLADLTPTLLELLGIEADGPFMGRSFAPTLTTGGAAASEPRAHRLAALGIEAVRTSTYKYIRRIDDPDADGKHEQQELLYDLAADPDERHDLAAERPELRREAALALDALNDACRAFVRAHPAPAASARNARDDPGWMIHRDDIDRKLRSLGYIE